MPFFSHIKSSIDYLLALFNSDFTPLSCVSGNQNYHFCRMYQKYIFAFLSRFSETTSSLISDCQILSEWIPSMRYM